MSFELELHRLDRLRLRTLLRKRLGIIIIAINGNRSGLQVPSASSASG